jgi:lipoprotein
MKKIGLLFLLIGTFFSCQKKEDGYLEDPYKGKLKVTYIEEAKGWVKNIALHNEELYFIRQDPFIGKIDSKGNTSSVTVTKSDNFNFNNDGSSVALSDSGDVYYTKGLLGPHKIFKYTPSTQQTTEIKVKYNPSYFEGREGILALTRYNNNEFMFFDFE